MWQEIPALYEIARQVCHEHGLSWTDPRTGVTHKPPVTGLRPKPKRKRAAKARRSSR
jgi:hypothetical protein